MSESRRQEAITDQPHIYAAHRLFFGPNRELRQLLEAWLLTTESFGSLAERFATQEPTVDFFEKLFFNVRDRLAAGDWIAKVVRGWPDNSVSNDPIIVARTQRKVALRVCGYYGGALAMDAVTAAFFPNALSQCADHAATRFDKRLLETVRTQAVAIAAFLNGTQSDTAPLSKSFAQKSRTSNSGEL